MSRGYFSLFPNCLLAVLICGPLASGIAASTTPPELQIPALASWLEEGLAATERLAVEEAAVAEARGQAVTLRAIGMPSARISLNAVNETEWRGGEADSTFVFGALGLARQPIFYFGEIEARREQGRLAVDLAQLRREEARLKLRQRLRALFFDALLQERQVALAERALELARQEESLAAERANRGEIAEAALFEARITMRERQLDRERAQAALARTRRDLAALELRPPETDSVGFPAPPVGEESGLPAVSESPEVMRYRLQLAQSEAAEVAARSSTKPKVDLLLRGSRSRNNFADANDVETFQLLAGVSVDWAVFDGFASRGRVLEQQARQRRLEIEAAEARLRWTAGFAERLDRLEVNRRERELAELRIKQASRDLNSAQGAVRRREGTERAVAAAELERARLKLEQDRLRAVAWLILGTLADAAEPGFSR